MDSAHDLLEGTVHQNQEARRLRVAKEGIVEGQIAAELAVPEIPLLVVQRRVDLVPEDAAVQNILLLLRGAEVLGEARDQKVELHGKSPLAVVMETAQQVVLIPKLLRHHLKSEPLREQAYDRRLSARGHPLDYNLNLTQFSPSSP